MEPGSSQGDSLLSCQNLGNCAKSERIRNKTYSYETLVSTSVIKMSMIILLIVEYQSILLSFDKLYKSETYRTDTASKCKEVGFFVEIKPTLLLNHWLHFLLQSIYRPFSTLLDCQFLQFVPCNRKLMGQIAKNSLFARFVSILKLCP